MYSYALIEFTLPPAATMQAKSATRAKKMAMDFMLFGWLVLVFALIRESIWNFFAGGVTGNNLGKIESVYIGGSEQY